MRLKECVKVFGGIWFEFGLSLNQDSNNLSLILTDLMFYNIYNIYYHI